MTQGLAITVVVCTGDSGGQLESVLRALARQTVARDAFEVVVVDTGENGRAHERARVLGAELVPRIAREPKAGRAAARNRGVALARGEILVFLGEVVVPGPGFLEAHLAAHRRLPHPGTVVQGVVRLSRSLASDPLGRVLAQIDGSPFPRRMSRAGEVSELAELRSDALSCKRAFLLEHGLFDPKLGSGCEEVELAWRLAPQGFTVVREPSAAATVERIPAFDDLCAAFTEEGASRFVLGRTHPQEPVQRFSQVEQARRLWPKLAPVADALVRSARELDRIVGLRRAAGLAVTSLDATLLERGYWTALRISRLSGMARKAAEMGFELGGAVSPTPLSATSTQM